MIQLAKNDYLKTSGIISLISCIAYMLVPLLGYKSIGFLFLATIFYLSTFTKKYALLYSAFLSTVIWNYFFIPPRYTFIIHNQEDLMMVFSYFFAAVVGGMLATRIKKQEEELHKLQLKNESKKLHDIILNSVSHEMKTPLTVLIGSASALRQASIFENKESREKLMGEIVNSANRITRVVGNLLDMSRLERNDLLLKKEWFTWEDLINELKSFLGEDLKNCTLEFKGDITNFVEADFSLLMLVFANLITNSIRHYSRDTKVEISISIIKDDDHYKIIVQDNGPGIPKEIINNIFDKFYTSPQSKTGGLGLGLAIARNIVELHRGKIKSVPHDNGAQFVLTLPQKASRFNFKVDEDEDEDEK